MLISNVVRRTYAKRITTKVLYNNTTDLRSEGLSRIPGLKISQLIDFIFAGFSSQIAYRSGLSPQHIVDHIMNVILRFLVVF